MVIPSSSHAARSQFLVVSKAVGSLFSSWSVSASTCLVAAIIPEFVVRSWRVLVGSDSAAPFVPRLVGALPSSCMFQPVKVDSVRRWIEKTSPRSWLEPVTFRSMELLGLWRGYSLLRNYSYGPLKSEPREFSFPKIFKIRSRGWLVRPN